MSNYERDFAIIEQTMKRLKHIRDCRKRNKYIRLIKEIRDKWSPESKLHKCYICKHWSFGWGMCERFTEEEMELNLDMKCMNDNEFWSERLNA